MRTLNEDWCDYLHFILKVKQYKNTRIANFIIRENITTISMLS